MQARVETLRTLGENVMGWPVVWPTNVTKLKNARTTFQFCSGAKNNATFKFGEGSINKYYFFFLVFSPVFLPVMLPHPG